MQNVTNAAEWDILRILLFERKNLYSRWVKMMRKMKKIQTIYVLWLSLGLMCSPLKLTYWTQMTDYEPPWYEVLYINDKAVEFKIDSSADVCVVTEHTIRTPDTKLLR